MATNSSEHLGLHLWEPTDQVLRTEFNQNWQKIDTAVDTAQQTAEAAYSPDNKPADIKQVTVSSSKAAGDAVLTLDFQPHHILLTAGDMAVLRSGITGTVRPSPYTSTAPTRYYTFILSGNQIQFVSS